jgi:hypothetical protein
MERINKTAAAMKTKGELLVFLRERPELANMTNSVCE